MLDVSDPEERGQYGKKKIKIKKPQGLTIGSKSHQTRMPVIERGENCAGKSGMKLSRQEWAGI